jgi:cytoskeleton protein RodZ
MNKGTFGEHLKREREMRGVSLAEIAAATRIASRFLQAIENEQWDQLPGGVFNKGFVRAVAHYLGLDEESIVAEYSLAAGVRPSVPVWTGSPPAVAPDQPWLAWILAAVIALALIAGGWFGVRRISAWRAARSAARTAVTAAPSPALETPPETALIASSEAAPNPVATPTPPARTTNSSPATTAPAAGAPAMGAPSPVGTPSAAIPFELKIETGKKTRVTVDTDAQRVFEGNIRPGEAHTFSARDQFQVSARDAGALLLELNGKTLGPIGPPGRPGKVTLTRDALKGTTGGGN